MIKLKQAPKKRRKSQIPTNNQMAENLCKDIKEKFGGDVGTVVINERPFQNFPRAYADARRH